MTTDRATLSLKCRVLQDREHDPCSGSTDDGTDGPCLCSCHAWEMIGDLTIDPAGRQLPVDGFGLWLSLKYAPRPPGAAQLVLLAGRAATRPE